MIFISASMPSSMYVKARFCVPPSTSLMSGACLLASLINPYTYHLHTHMAAYLRDPWNSQHIMEFLSPSFHHPTAIFFEGMLLLAASTAVWNVSRGRLTEPILMGGAPRSIAILNGTLAAALGIGLRLWVAGLLLWFVGHMFAVWAAKRDPFFVEVVWRHVRYPSHLGT